MKNALLPIAAGYGLALLIHTPQGQKVAKVLGAAFPEALAGGDAENGGRSAASPEMKKLGEGGSENGKSEENGKSDEDEE